MIILPEGLLRGERLASCSDEAQVHFARILALANGYGRMELNAKTILREAYANFRVPPTHDDLAGWLREYARAHLLFIYKAEDGKPWGQWCGAPPQSLPKWKTAADRRSPEPNPSQIAAFMSEYAEKKRRASEESGDFLNIAEDFQSLPKTSEGFESLLTGIGVGVGKGVGGGEGEKQKHTSPSAPLREKKRLQETLEQRVTQGTNGYSPSGPEQNGMESFESSTAANETQMPCGNDKQRSTAGVHTLGETFDSVATASKKQIPYGNDKQMAQQVYAVYPKKVGGKEALRSIGKAIDRLRGNGTADPVAYLIARVEAWLAKRARDEKAGAFVPSYPNPATWFNQERYNDPDNAPKPKMEIYVLSPEEASALWERDFGKYVQVHSGAG